jgi:hypothetical protein
MKTIKANLGLGLEVNLVVNDDTDEEMVLDFVYKIVDQLGVHIAKPVGEVLSKLARVDELLDALGEEDFFQGRPKERKRTAKQVQETLRASRDLLRPINSELWGNALESSTPTSVSSSASRKRSRPT